MTYQSFSTSAGPGRPKCSWTSSSCSRVGLSLKHKLRISVTEMAREAALHSYDRVDRHLRRATLVVGAFGFRRLPFNAELVERLACDTGETLGTMQHRFAAQARDDRPAIHTVAKPHQAALVHQRAQCTEHLILATEFLEFARKEHVFTPVAGDPLFNLLPQCFTARHNRPPFAKTRHSI